MYAIFKYDFVVLIIYRNNIKSYKCMAVTG